MECVYCVVRTGSLYTASLTFSNSAFCPHSVFICFVWIWEQTAIISLYSINWLVCITETECVYCAVRTGSLYTASLTFSNSTFCPHSVFMCFVWIWEQTVIISLYCISWRVFITETECVSCRTRSQVSPCEIWDKLAAGQVILPVLLDSPVSIISPVLHTYIQLHAAATGRMNGRSLGTSKKQCSFESSVPSLA